ncbi:hypothetical protein DEU56DRAFT_835634 [Suillus clintonianus]|uniref:uncharacterized protein n=1 Tax=Suillus clintonianus TaxID=1904413 RepID=UPI001B866ACF|nr:uncharacterized protein DEU56DRAFT_835634 [Suillus clintonianus]KAG2120272.1 hypothetical protein DEU56DRAFT_835634 [Suillus clintonianus]
MEVLPSWLNTVPEVASCAGRVLLAKNLVEMLPRELPSIDQPEKRATEYLHYRQFFTMQDSLDRVLSIMNRNTRAAWLIEQAYNAVVKLLTSDWMMPGETGDRCSRELTRTRQIYLPELNTAAACHTLRRSRAYPRVNITLHVVPAVLTHLGQESEARI